jgi:polar amino acid transport system substrate-binding protein
MKFAYAADAEPFSWEENGKTKGIFIDITNETLQNRMGIRVSHQNHPWKRSQYLAQIGKVDALVTNGLWRRAWAGHSSEAVATLRHMLYINADGPKFNQLSKVHTLEGLKPFRLVDHLGSGWVENKLAGKGYDVHLVADPDAMYRMVAMGRVDAVAFNDIMSRYQIKKLGLQDQLVEVPLDIDAVPFHIVIRKTSPYIKLLQKIDETLIQMKQDGALQKIFDKYR